MSPAKSKSPLTPPDLLKLRAAGALALRPGSSDFAFVEAWSEGDDNSNRMAIWFASLEAKDAPRRITFGEKRDWVPKWSPDGTRLAFLSIRETDWRPDLYVLDMSAGGEPQLVAKLPRGVDSFAWSPDGKQFALTGQPEFPDDRHRPTNDPDERRKRYAERIVFVDRMHYRNDGQQLVDDEESWVWVCSAKGGKPKPIVESDYPTHSPGWTPDGLVCFLSSRDPDHELTWDTQLWAVSPKGGNPKNISNAPGLVSGYAFNDQGQLAYLAAPTKGLPMGCYHTQMHVDGKLVSDELGLNVGKHVLADTIDLLAWSGTSLTPHGNDFYVSMSDQGAVFLYRYRDGSFERILDGNRVVGEFAIGDDKIVFTNSAPDDPASIRVSDLDGSSERVFYDPNPWFSDREVSKWKELWVEVDGVKSQAWVMLPPGGISGNSPAGILALHGGPHGAFGWSFNWQLQWLAAPGYSVIFGNPPGSLTYGEEFAQLIHRAWGEADLPACLAFCDAAVKQGLADEERLGVYGASYGGYLTLWTVGHTDRFKAALAARPPANLESEWATSEFGWALMHSCFGVHPWEDPELFRRLSPLTYAENITTPLRLIGCTTDYRVPLEQSEQMFIKLKILGKVVDFVIFRESHMLVLAGKPWSRVIHMQAINEWFVEQLPPGSKSGQPKKARSKATKKKPAKAGASAKGAGRSSKRSKVKTGSGGR